MKDWQTPDVAPLFTKVLALRSFGRRIVFAHFDGARWYEGQDEIDVTHWMDMPTLPD